MQSTIRVHRVIFAILTTLTLITALTTLHLTHADLAVQHSRNPSTIFPRALKQWTDYFLPRKYRKLTDYYRRKHVRDRANRTDTIRISDWCILGAICNQPRCTEACSCYKSRDNEIVLGSHLQKGLHALLQGGKLSLSTEVVRKRFAALFVGSHGGTHQRGCQSIRSPVKFLFSMTSITAGLGSGSKAPSSLFRSSDDG